MVGKSNVVFLNLPRESAKHKHVYTYYISTLL